MPVLVALLTMLLVVMVGPLLLERLERRILDPVRLRPRGRRVGDGRVAATPNPAPPREAPAAEPSPRRSPSAWPGAARPGGQHTVARPCPHPEI